jgi:hypothetical protein
MEFSVGDLFVYQDEYECRQGKSKVGLVLEVMGKIHHDIDDVCLTVFIDGKVTEEWQSFLLKLY